MLSPVHHAPSFCPSSSKRPGTVIPALLPLLDNSYNASVSPGRNTNNIPNMKVRAPAKGCFGNFPTPLNRETPSGSSIPTAQMNGSSIPPRIASPTCQDSPNAPRPEPTHHVHHPFLEKGYKKTLSSSQQRPKPETKPPPPSAGIHKRRANLPTTFRRHYDRGDLPLCVKHQGTSNGLDWKIQAERLDYHHFLPIFFDGVREPGEPHRSISFKGTYELLKANTKKSILCIPQLILPIKLALDTRSPQPVSDMLKILQFFLLLSDEVGVAFLPFLRQLLPMFLLYTKWHRSTGDSIDYSQFKREDIGDLATETLQLFETKGGPAAYKEIKRIIPCYESCVGK